MNGRVHSAAKLPAAQDFSGKSFSQLADAFRSVAAGAQSFDAVAYREVAIELSTFDRDKIHATQPQLRALANRLTLLERRAALPQARKLLGDAANLILAMSARAVPSAAPEHPSKSASSHAPSGFRALKGGPTDVVEDPRPRARSTLWLSIAQRLPEIRKGFSRRNLAAVSPILTELGFKLGMHNVAHFNQIPQKTLSAKTALYGVCLARGGIDVLNQVISVLNAMPAGATQIEFGSDDEALHHPLMRHYRDWVQGFAYRELGDALWSFAPHCDAVAYLTMFHPSAPTYVFNPELRDYSTPRRMPMMAMAAMILALNAQTLTAMTDMGTDLRVINPVEPSNGSNGRVVGLKRPRFGWGHTPSPPRATPPPLPPSPRILPEAQPHVAACPPLAPRVSPPPESLAQPTPAPRQFISPQPLWPPAGIDGALAADAAASASAAPRGLSVLQPVASPKLGPPNSSLGAQSPRWAGPGSPGQPASPRAPSNAPAQGLVSPIEATSSPTSLLPNPLRLTADWCPSESSSAAAAAGVPLSPVPVSAVPQTMPAATQITLAFAFVDAPLGVRTIAVTRQGWRLRCTPDQLGSLVADAVSPTLSGAVQVVGVNAAWLQGTLGAFRALIANPPLPPADAGS